MFSHKINPAVFGGIFFCSKYLLYSKGKRIFMKLFLKPFGINQIKSPHPPTLDFPNSLRKHNGQKKTKEKQRSLRMK